MTPPKPLPSLTSDDQKRANRLKAIAEDAPSKLGLFQRVFAGVASPRSAIKGKCMECLSFNADDIRNCTAPACPLFRYRPFQRGGAE